MPAQNRETAELDKQIEKESRREVDEACTGQREQDTRALIAQRMWVQYNVHKKTQLAAVTTSFAACAAFARRIANAPPADKLFFKPDTRK